MEELLRKIGVDINVTFSLIFFSLIWVRIVAMTAILPFLFSKPVPRYVTLGASMILALFVYPSLLPAEPPPLSEDRLFLVILYLKEVFYGLCMGFAVGIIFHAFSSAGQMIDNQRGVSIARILIPQLGQQASISSAFLFQLGIVIYLSLGGHDLFLQSFFLSFKSLPVLAFPTVGPGLFPLMDMFMRITGEVIRISMQMAMPVIIAILMADIILGLANRMAPQINVWELGFNVKGYLGILMLFLSITVVASQMEHYAFKSGQYVEEGLGYLQGKVPEGAPELPVPEEGLQKPEDGVPRVKTVE